MKEVPFEYVVKFAKYRNEPWFGELVRLAKERYSLSPSLSAWYIVTNGMNNFHDVAHQHGLSGLGREYEIFIFFLLNEPDHEKSN